jgi:hypothetical protein
MLNFRRQVEQIRQGLAGLEPAGGCATCRRGHSISIVEVVEGEPDPPLPTCPECGRVPGGDGVKQIVVIRPRKDPAPVG